MKHFYYYQLCDGGMFRIESDLAVAEEVEKHKNDGPGLQVLLELIDSNWVKVWERPSSNG